jgi:hypothetical protein
MMSSYRACSKCGRIHPYNHRCYKGESGIRRKNTSANNFRKTTDWKKKSEEIRIDSKYLCSVCLDHNIYNYNRLEVHHITPLEEDITRALDNYNLICLCNEHHRLAEEGNIDKEYLYKLASKREGGEK